MGEVTASNFEDKYSDIEEKLRRCAFVAVDSEFSGLVSSSELKNSLFDSGDDRYKKLRRNVENFRIIQVGITTFEYGEFGNKYFAYKYSFYICPRTFASFDDVFMSQAAALEFLCEQNFDFNKWIYNGIAYLNRQQRSRLKEELKSGSLFCTISFEDEAALQSECSSIAKWLTNASLGDSMYLDSSKQQNKRLIYILQKEVRKRFHSVWTFVNKGQVRVEKICEIRRKELEENEAKEGDLEEDVLNSVCGFSRIFELLIQVKKPIVGHNLLLDLMFMYNQFYKTLPDSLAEFKKEIHKLFPVIYDTKFLSFELRKLLKKEEMWESNALGVLYNYFREGKGRHIVLFSPAIQIQGNDDSQSLNQHCGSDEKIHDAGWDSYFAGYCFIRMAHLFANQSLGKFTDGSAMKVQEHLNAVSSKKNRVNVIRGGPSHVCLDGPDPASSRPPWLHVQAIGFHNIDTEKMVELFARFGAVDVKPLSRHRALVAVGNYGSAEDILKEYRNHKMYRITCYHPVWHSPFLGTLLWSSLILSTGICLYVCRHNFHTIRWQR